MRKRTINGILAGAALAALVPTVHGAVLLSDTMTNATEAGSLAGSAPDTTGTGTWVTSYYDGSGELAPTTQTDSTGAGFSTPMTTGIMPVDASRSASGANFGGYNNHTDDNAFIAVPFAPVGLITSSATVTFNNTASSGNPTAWAFVGLATSLSDPDVINTTSQVGPWALIRPASNGTDDVEVYATGGTGHDVVNSSVGASSAAHTIQLAFDPAAGTLNVFVDGTDVLANPYSYAANSLAIPNVVGDMIGDRTNTGNVSGTNPSSAVFSNVLVTQAVPEPASLSMLGLSGLLLGRRRRLA